MRAVLYQYLRYKLKAQFMKSKIILFIALLFSFQLIAQTNGVNYKAIVKDGSGDILANANVTVEFNILAGSAQSLIYSEVYSTTTDVNGLIILIIGQGTTSDVFDDIDWSRFEHYLNVKMDTGSGLVDLGTTQFEAIPYALQAENSNYSGLAATAERVTLKSGTTNQFNISYSSTGDKLRILEYGVSGNVLEISGGELYLPQYAGSDNGPLKVDASGKVVSEVILPPGPQETKFNRYEFNQKEVYPASGYTKYYYGIQFEDGTVLTGVKALIMDNNTSGSSGDGNTAFVGIYRQDKIDNTQFPLPIYRIDGSDTPTNVFEEFTQTNLAQSGSNIIDNSTYIYIFQMFVCDDCKVQEASVLH